MGRPCGCAAMIAAIVSSDSAGRGRGTTTSVVARVSHRATTSGASPTRATTAQCGSAYIRWMKARNTPPGKSAGKWDGCYSARLSESRLWPLSNSRAKATAARRICIWRSRSASST